MPDGPSEKRLRTGPFAAHAARGIVRDQRTRRGVMGILLATAVVMIVLGSTLMEPWLTERGHLLWFFLFWAACGWLTVTALLLALFDILMVRAQARAARKAFRQNLEPD
jgi:hypothetical protein